jgi:hypothetical protein
MTDPNLNDDGDDPNLNDSGTDDITRAFHQAVAEAMPADWDITEAMGSAVFRAMPATDAILDALTPWVPLPTGSHLRLGDDDRRGVAVVALRSRWAYIGQRGVVLTERGAVLDLDDDRRLHVGRSR